MTVEELVGDPNYFKSWVEGYESDDLVGWANSNTSCPIANFLDEKTGCIIEVGMARIQVNREGRIALPIWMCRFIDAIDKYGGPIRARQCLEVLEVVRG